MLNTLGVIFVTLLFVAGYSHYMLKLGQLKQERERNGNLYNNLLAAEQLKIAAQTELNFLKQSIQQLMERPVMSMMNEQQMQSITGAIVSYIGTIKDPKTAN